VQQYQNECRRQLQFAESQSPSRRSEDRPFEQLCGLRNTEPDSHHQGHASMRDQYAWVHQLTAEYRRLSAAIQDYRAKSRSTLGIVRDETESAEHIEPERKASIA
jgi:hypothetical protein